MQGQQDDTKYDKTGGLIEGDIILDSSVSIRDENELATLTFPSTPVRGIMDLTTKMRSDASKNQSLNLSPTTMRVFFDGDISNAPLTITSTQTTIKNVVTPKDDNDAVNKKYIDNQVSIPEDLANSLELGTDPTVADALAALAERNTNYEDLIAGQLQIMTSQYEGTGTYGASNPISLEIPGKPLAIWISPTGQDPRQDIWGLRGTTQLHYGVNTYNPLVTWGDESISWYSASNATYQGNVSSIVYNVLVIYEPKTFDGPVKLTVLDSRGDPCVGCVVTGVYSKAGIKCRTNAQGVASGYGTSGQECTIQSAYIDLKDKNFTMPTISATGIEISETLEDTPTTEVVIVNTSQIVRMSRDRKADVAIVGGGTGGRGGNGATASGNGLPDGMYGSGGSGGAGGKVLNLSDLTIASGAYSLVIGAGGSGGYGGSGTTVSSSASTSGTAGTAGGDTTWGIYSSANGIASGVPLSDSTVIAGGPGGGGGRGGATTGSITSSTTRNSGSAGTRAGGKGGDGGRGGRGGDAGLAGSKGGPGGGGGGGGGGGSGMYYDEYGRGGNGGAGGPGCLVIRFKE